MARSQTATTPKTPARRPAPQAEPRWLDEDEQRAWRNYLRASAQVDDLLDRDLQQYGVSLSEYEVLAMLSEAPERSMRMSVLADVVVQSRSRLTHTAARMEKRGWVERRPVEHDKRGVDLCLTDAGMDELDVMAAVHVDGVRRALVDALGHEDFLQLGRLMQRVREALPEPD